MEDFELRIAIKTIDSITIVEQLAADHGRENVNCQQMADLMHKDNFNANLGNPDVSFKDNMKVNHIKKDMAYKLLNAYNERRK